MNTAPSDDANQDIPQFQTLPTARTQENEPQTPHNLQHIYDFQFQSVRQNTRFLILRPDHFKSRKDEKNQQKMLKYLQYRKPLPNEFDPSDPYLKLSLLTNNFVPNHQDVKTEFIVNHRGMVGSLKNTSNEDLMIGRQYSCVVDGKTIFPNDIQLPQKDRSTSRLHCKILTKYAFASKHPFSKEFILFLTKFSHKFDLKVIRTLWDFIKPYGLFYLQDIGSTFGTYRSVPHNNPVKLEKGQIFQIGVDQKIVVLDLGFQEKDRISYVTLQVNGSAIQEENQKGKIYILQSQKQQCFRIGRSDDCYIRINQNTISRKQCRVVYSEGKNTWYILDGELNKGSANGTWLKLQNHYHNQQQNEEAMMLIENGMEIKVSDSILKVEMVNFKKRMTSKRQVVLGLESLMDAVWDCTS